MSSPAYPVTLAIDYPDRALNRASSFFRAILIIPAGLMLALLVGPQWGWHESAWRFFFATSVFLFLPTLLMILFRRTYPRWWFDWNLSFTRFAGRVGAYAALLNDEYPSTEREPDRSHRDTLSEREGGASSGIAPGEVVSRHTAHVHLVLPRHRGWILRFHFMVRDSLHGALSPILFSIRGRCGPLGAACERIRISSGDGRLSAILARVEGFDRRKGDRQKWRRAQEKSDAPSVAPAPTPASCPQVPEPQLHSFSGAGLGLSIAKPLLSGSSTQFTVEPSM